MPPLVEGARDGTGAPLLLCRVPALAERLLAPTDGVELLGGGLPVFARVPAAASWWSGPRWRVCQEAAADLALAALSSPSPPARAFCAQPRRRHGAHRRRRPSDTLRAARRARGGGGGSGGLQPGCCVTGTNVVMQGPVIVAFREDPAVFSGALLGVSALLDGGGVGGARGRRCPREAQAGAGDSKIGFQYKSEPKAALQSGGRLRENQRIE